MKQAIMDVLIAITYWLFKKYYYRKYPPPVAKAAAPISTKNIRRWNMVDEYHYHIRQYEKENNYFKPIAAELSPEVQYELEKATPFMKAYQDSAGSMFGVPWVVNRDCAFITLYGHNIFKEIPVTDQHRILGSPM